MCVGVLGVLSGMLQAIAVSVTLAAQLLTAPVASSLTAACTLCRNMTVLAANMIAKATRPAVMQVMVADMAAGGLHGASMRERAIPKAEGSLCM